MAAIARDETRPDPALSQPGKLLRFLAERSRVGPATSPACDVILQRHRTTGYDARFLWLPKPVCALFRDGEVPEAALAARE